MNNKSETIILAIESSCDDTSCAVLVNNKVLSNVTANQKVHEAFGGVVPELASRAHQQNIVPVVDAALNKAEIKPNDIDAIAFTRGPGLLGSLLVGTSFAKSYAQALNKPLIEVNHMEGHVLAHLIDQDNMEIPQFPFLCLTVSGGHTQLLKVSSPYQIEILGETIDDAAGEAFDKAAKLLGLPYPGGPMIDKLAKEGDPHRFEFPQPKIQGLNFSFSGLKTSILYFLQKEMRKDDTFIENNLKDLCASIQYTIVTALMAKVKRAIRETNIKRIAIAGGVSANQELRSTLTALEKKNKWKVFIPPFEYTTDNAAMIGITAYYKYLKEMFSDYSVAPKARLKIGSDYMNH